MTIDATTLDRIFAAPSLGAPENAVGFVLWRIVHRYVRELDRALAPLDLTHLQFTILTLAAWLAQSSDAVTQAQLARFGDIHPMQVSNVLKALEGKGLVDRPASQIDTRAKLVTITETGVTALRHALPIAVEVQAKLFGEAGQPGGALLVELAKVENVPVAKCRAEAIQLPQV